MPKTKVLITVKTYPALSSKYEELVCTAGLREDGSWVRIYPVQFRRRNYDEQYSKYDWRELDLVKNTSDPRPESFRPVSDDTEIKKVGHLDTDGKGLWKERRKIVLRNLRSNLIELIEEAKDPKIATSLAVYKPREIIDFTAIPEKEREWSSEKLAFLQQGNLFEKRGDRIQIVRKLPYKFKYKFLDEKGKERNLMIEDWETGQLFWRMLDKYKDEKIACGKVREKYLDDFARTKDLYFYLGTTKLNQFRAPNPFVIIGTFHPKPIKQMSLFD